MPKLRKKAGATSEIWQVFIQDSSSTIGAALTGLAFNTASLTAYYHRDTDTTATAITLATMTVGTFTSSGFKEIDATNMPGWYQFCPPNAAIAASAKSCAFHLKGAANMAPLPIEVQLESVDPDEPFRQGMTAFPAVVPGANGGLATCDANNSIKTQGNVKKNTAFANFEFLLTDSTTHAPKTSASSIVPTRSIDGAAFAAGTLSSVTEVAFGIYRVDFAAADLNGNCITLRVAATSCDDSFDRIITFV